MNGCSRSRHHCSCCINFIFEVGDHLFKCQDTLRCFLPFLFSVWLFQYLVPWLFEYYYLMVWFLESAELWKKCDIFADSILSSAHDIHTVISIMIFCWSSVPCIKSSWATGCLGLWMFMYNCFASRLCLWMHAESVLSIKDLICWVGWVITHHTEYMEEVFSLWQELVP